MIEKRLVQWYAADAGVDLDIAEREIVLTYVLRILSDAADPYGRERQVYRRLVDSLGNRQEPGVSR